MDSIKYEKADELVKSMLIIDKIESAFKRNEWVKIAAPNFKDGIDLTDLMWSDLREFLKTKGDEYEKAFAEL